MFLARLSKDGISSSIYNLNDEYTTTNKGIALPNCTTYVFYRSAEISGQSVKQGYSENPMLSRSGWGNAKDFYRDAHWSVGSVPKVGAICCWGSDSDQYGHVAVVEEVIDDSTVIVSQSNYQKTYFEIKTYTCIVGKVTNGVGYAFNGYLYNPFIKDIRVERDKNKYQVKVKADLLKARDSNGNWLDGLYIPKGIYDVDSVFDRDGYTWARVGDVIFALNDSDDWTETYPTDAEPSTDLDRLFDEIKKSLKEKDERIALLESKIESIRKVLEV